MDFSRHSGYANGRNKIATRAGRQTVKSHSSRFERRAARGSGVSGSGRTLCAAHKQTRRMVAQATGSAAPLVYDPHAPSQHRSKGPSDASVTRRGALPWPARPVGSGQHAIAVSIAPGLGGSGSFRAPIDSVLNFL